MVNRSLALVSLLVALLFAVPTAWAGPLNIPDAQVKVTVYVGDIALPDRAWVEAKASEAMLLFDSVVNIVYEEAPSEVSGGAGPICDWIMVTLVDDKPPVEIYTDPLCLIGTVQDIVNG